MANENNQHIIIPANTFSKLKDLWTDNVVVSAVLHEIEEYNEQEKEKGAKVIHQINKQS